MPEAFFGECIRTPIGRYGGSRASLRPDDLAPYVLRALRRRRPSVDPAAIDVAMLVST